MASDSETSAPLWPAPDRSTKESSLIRTYVGRRSNGTRWVEVLSDGHLSPLVNRGQPCTQDFGWGGHAAGSVSLAHSILWDVLGVASSQSVAVVFAGDVIARLPEDSFSLSEAEVRHWLDARDQPRMSADELVEHLGSLALAEPEEEASALRLLVDRCWSRHSLAN